MLAIFPPNRFICTNDYLQVRKYIHMISFTEVKCKLDYYYRAIAIFDISKGINAVNKDYQ